MKPITNEVLSSPRPSPQASKQPMMGKIKQSQANSERGFVLRPRMKSSKVKENLVYAYANIPSHQKRPPKKQQNQGKSSQAEIIKPSIGIIPDQDQDYQDYDRTTPRRLEVASRCLGQKRIVSVLG